MKKHTLHTLAAMTAFVATSSLMAYTTEWDDSRVGSSRFELGGTIVGSLQFVDRDASGGIANETHGKDLGGFNIDRAYLIARGKVNEGDYKGWAYRVTLDATSSGHDKNRSFLKHAYVDMPAAAGTFRIGMHPVASGYSAVHSTDGVAGNRALSLNKDTRTAGAWEGMGFGSSTDIGISYFQKADWGGFQLGLFNGEGYKGQNASSISNHLASGKDLTNLAAGNNVDNGFHAGQQGAGVDLQGLVNFKLANSDAFKLDFSVPFAMKNVMFTERGEYEFTKYELAAGQRPEQGTMSMYSGDRRAKADYMYGLQLDANMKIGDGSLKFGGGPYFHVDRRGSATKLDLNADMTGPTSQLHYANLNKGTAYLYGAMNRMAYSEEDQTAMGRFMYMTYRQGQFGVSLQRLEGEGQTIGQLASGTSKSVLDQFLNMSGETAYTGKDNTSQLGHNITETQVVDAMLGTGIDWGQANWRRDTVALYWYPTPRATVALGHTRQVGTNTMGGDNYISKYVHGGTANHLEFGTTTDTMANLFKSGVTDANVAGYITPALINRMDGKRDVEEDWSIVMIYNF